MAGTRYADLCVLEQNQLQAQKRQAIVEEDRRQQRGQAAAPGSHRHSSWPVRMLPNCRRAVLHMS